MPLGLDHLVQPDDVGMRDAPEDANLPIDLSQAGRVVADTIALDEFDSNLRGSCQ